MNRTIKSPDSDTITNGVRIHAAARYVGMSPDDGALSQLRAATDPTARGGEFYGPLLQSGGRCTDFPTEFLTLGLELLDPALGLTDLALELIHLLE